MLVVVRPELGQLPFEISRGPEQQTIQAFAPNGPNQSFDDRMGPRHVRHRLHFTDVEDPQVRLPLMKPVQRIMVRTEVGRQKLAARRAIEHSAQRHPSTTPRCAPKPTMRRVQWSIKTSTQYVWRTADSHRNRSTLHRLSFAWPRTVSHDGPQDSGVGTYRAARIRRTTSRSMRYRRPTRSAARSEDTPNSGSAASYRRRRRSPPRSALWARPRPSNRREKPACWRSLKTDQGKAVLLTEN